jgi:hypothetical protein
MRSVTKLYLIRSIAAALLLCFGAVIGHAEPFQTIINNGDPQNRVDLAVLGDGYTAAEQQKYQNDVQNFLQGFFAQEPFHEYQRYLNVHRIDVISSQSGADHPERNFFVNTALDAAYNCGGIQRLICVNTSNVNAVVSNTLGPAQHDMVLVIVNDSEYGGSGGAVAVASTNAAVVELVLHEEGHSFGFLADEYGGPPPPSCNNSVEPFQPNATKETQRSLIKWNHWIDQSTPIPTTSTNPGVPGLYQAALYCDVGLYRPTYLSKMRALNFPYEQINVEQLIKRIYSYVIPFDSATPAPGDVMLAQGQMQSFTVSTPLPFTHSLSISWLVDNQQQATGPTYILDSTNLSPGDHSVAVMISDPTTMVRSDPSQLLKAQRFWTVTVTTTVPTLEFSASNYNANEGDVFATITVNRMGDTSAASSVDFATGNNTATQTRDYEVANGTLTFAAGDTSKTFRVLIVNDVYAESSETVNLTLSNPTNGALTAPSTATLIINDNDSAGTTSPVSRQFVSNLVGADEVPATGNTVKGNGGIVQLSTDETSAKVSLIFSGLTGAETGAHVHAGAPGVNGPIIFGLPLGNPINDQIFNPTPQQVIDLRAGQQYMNVHSSSFMNGEIRGQLMWNPAEEADFFVRQAYFDFLSRVPDAGGFAFWQNEITQCQSNVQCLRNKRVDVSNAFFYEQEFQQTAAYVLRLYSAAYGNNQPFPNPNPNPGFPNEEKKLPSYAVFVSDRARVIGGANLAQKQQDLANLFVTRAEFSAKYPLSLATADQFVDAVLATVLNDLGVNLQSQRTNLINLYNAQGSQNAGRAQVLYRLADDNASNPIVNQPLIDAEYNRTFVLGQYFGYLRRNPDIPGFIFWLGQVNGAALRDVPKQHAMVCSFITSAEYQFRFGPVASRNNNECPQ